VLRSSRTVPGILSLLICTTLYNYYYSFPSWNYNTSAHWNCWKATEIFTVYNCTVLLTITPNNPLFSRTSSSVEVRYLGYLCEAGREVTGKWAIRWFVKYTEQKWIQKHPLKIRVRKICGGANYASRCGVYVCVCACVRVCVCVLGGKGLKWCEYMSAVSSCCSNNVWETRVVSFCTTHTYKHN
jgi:hypothetical protein